MRRITTWLLSTITALVLLFSYHTSTSATPAATDTPLPVTSPQASESADSGSTADSSGSSGSTSGSTADTSGSQTFLGDAVNTRYGPVQVQIVVSGGKVVSSEVTQVPWNDHKDIEINSYAVPILNSEAVAAQSAQIDMVSGATYTSDAYITSLQSALDQAGL